MSNGKRLAFDFGSVRIGVAASDNSGILVSPLEIIVNDENLEVNLRNILHEVEPIYIVIGIPNKLSGAPGSNQSDVNKFVDKIKSITQIPIFGIDERLSTVSAAAKLRDSGKNAKTSKDLIDSAAAVGILELAMEFEKSGGLAKCEL